MCNQGLGKGKPFFLFFLVGIWCAAFLSSPWCFEGRLHGAEATFAWDAAGGAAGYKIHYGTASKSYSSSIDVGNATTYTLTNIPDGSAYYFAATAYDAAGIESDASNEVVFSTVPCSYTITPASASFTATGGQGSITVTTQSGCAWSASSGASWVTITSGSNGTGSGVVNYSVAANAGASRTAASTIAGQVFTFVQAGSESYTILAYAGTGGSISPAGSTVVGSGASKSFTVNPANGYRICDVTVDGVSVGAASVYTFINVTANHTIAATFTYGTTSFGDVSSVSIYKSYIEAISSNGITTGCGNNNYCPSQDVTREQMAAFLIRAIYGETFTYTGTPYFNDVPAGDIFFTYIQKLKDLNVTVTSDAYFPGEGVSRGQLAAFLVRALQARAGEPTEGFVYTGTPYFTDVPADSGYFAYVQRLRDLGITVVTGIYNVDEIVTREQMAAFLARAFLGMQ